MHCYQGRSYCHVYFHFILMVPFLLTEAPAKSCTRREKSRVSTFGIEAFWSHQVVHAICIISTCPPGKVLNSDHVFRNGTWFTFTSDFKSVLKQNFKLSTTRNWVDNYHNIILLSSVGVCYKVNRVKHALLMYISNFHVYSYTFMQIEMFHLVIPIRPQQRSGEPWARRKRMTINVKLMKNHLEQ